MTRMYLQYLIIFLKSFSMLFLPKGSDHFLLALVNAFFLLLYLNNTLNVVLVLVTCLRKQKKNKSSHRNGRTTIRAEKFCSHHVRLLKLRRNASQTNEWFQCLSIQSFRSIAYITVFKLSCYDRRAVLSFVIHMLLCFSSKIHRKNPFIYYESI